ncbi:MAG TPA: cache domain-containing protein, partial [Anaerolineaceae bacterium]
MRNLKIGSLQWWVGAYCSFLGAVLLVTPHNFDLPVTSFLQSRSWIFGTGLVLAGIAMFAAAILVPSRAATLAAHLSVGLLLTAVAVVSWRSHDWLTAIDSLVFGLGTIFAGLIYDPTPPQTPARYNLMTFLLGLVSALMGLLLLALPARVQPLVAVQVWQYIPAFGVLFLAAAWLLFFVLYPLQGAGTASRQWPGIPWLANLAAAFIWLVFLSWALFPAASWTDQAFYAMAAAYLLIYPWLVTYSPFPFRTSLHARFTLMLAVAVAIPVIVTVAWVSQREETTARDRTVARLRHDSSGLASQITDFIGRYQAGVQAAAEVPGLIGLDQTAQIRDLQLFQGAYPDLRSIALFDREGQPLARSDVLGYTPAVGDPVFEKVRRLLKPQVGLLPSPVNHQPELVFGAPVMDGGKFVGFVEGGLGTGHLTEVVTPHSDVTILNYVLDDTGRTVLASPA